MENNNNQKPCVVETPQGFSVSYNKRFLYSKYYPSKLINNQIQNLTILPGTIFICTSPALCYGLSELLNKLPDNCLVYLCEFDESLQSFAKESEIYKKIINNNVNELLYFPTVKELYDLPITIFNNAKKGKYRRIIRIDFSTGYQFNAELYNQLEEACVNSIKTFWTNRLTLTKFGRKYSHNFFTNLLFLKNTTPIENYFKSVKKPILVVGAGESVDNLYSIITNDEIRNSFFILCVDTILAALIEKNIIPDGVFLEEAQVIISKAFICNKYNIQLFSGLTSIPLISQYFKPENISYFATEYTNSIFFDDIKSKGILPHVNPPFGSVGLTAVYYSLCFRANINIPIYITGLDFSYSIGKTHGKNTIAHKLKLIGNNKLSSIENYNAAFSQTSQHFLDKNNNLFITTPSLANYANLFRNIFKGNTNIFDISPCGIDLGLPQCSLQEEYNRINDFYKTSKPIINKSSYDKQFIEKLDDYILNEVNQLKYLKHLLTENSSFSKDDLESEITKIAANKEYLYLHFADGFSFNYNQSFLNRIRTEIDFFLKIFD